MATPRGPSLQAMNVARDMRRTFPGGRNGRTGLAPTKRAPQPTGTRVPSTGTLHYYGAMNVGIGTAVGDSLSGGDNFFLPEATPTDDFQNGAAASWSLVDGEFTATAGGYWALWCAVAISGCDPDDKLTLKLTAETIGIVEMPLLNDGGDVRGAAQIGPAPAFPDTTAFIAKVHFSGTGSPVWAGGQMSFWPTGLFPEVSA
jgi:hypothetical protein